MARSTLRSDTVSGHGDDRRSEVEDRADARRDEPVRHLLGRGGRRRDDPDLDPAVAHERGEIVDRLDGEIADALADLRRVRVDQRQHPEPAGTEAPVVGEGLTEVAEPDDRDRPVRGEPELGGDPVHENSTSPVPFRGFYKTTNASQNDALGNLCGVAT